MSYVRGNPYATREQAQADARRLAWEKQQEENRKKEEENRKQAQETEAQARKEQDALEKERLKQLADAQPDASAFQGAGLMTPSGSTFDPNMGYTGSGVYNRPPTETKRTPTYEELFGVPESAERIAYDKEQARLEEQARKERQEADRKRREAYFAEQERIKSDALVAKGKELVGSYRDTYSAEQLFELGSVDSFEIAKAVADETYKQYWYDKANDIIGNFTDEDYKLIAEPQYETYRVGKGGGVERTRQVLPEGYEELLKAQEYIEKGPLDFSNEETHKMLIKPPKAKGGYGKYQEWIDESDPLRQAVEAQADVMTKYLDNEGISIVKDFEDGNPDNIYGEGVYLNTGTAAHIDWDSELKRGQSYQSTPDAELGSYSQVFYRPEKESILDNVMVDVIAAVTGTTPYLTAARGGDFEDIAKSIVAKQVAPDILENTLASVNVDADLFGIDPDTFSEGITEVQTAVIEGGSIQDAVGSAFGGELLDAAGEVFEDIAPVIDVPEIVEDLGNAVVAVAEPVLNTIEEISEPVVQATQAVIEPIITPIVETVEEITPEIQETFEQLIEEVAPIVEKVIVEPVEEIAPVVEELAKVITPIVEDVVVEPVEKIVETLTPVVEKAVVEPVEQIAPVVEEVIEPVTSVVENVADNLGIDNELVGVTEERFSEVMSEAEEAMLAGESGKDVIIKELGGDIIGELGGGAENLLGIVIDVAETVLSPVEPLVEPFADLAGAVLSPVGDILETGVDVAGEVLSPIGDVIEAGISAGSDVLSNVEDVVSDITSEGEDIVRAGGRAVDEAIIQPVLGAVEPVIETIEAGGRAIDKNVIQPVLGAVEPVIETIEAGGRVVDKNVIQPTIETIGEGIDTISDITSEAEDFVRAGGRVVDKNVIQPTIETIRETGRAIDKNITQPTIETIDEIVRNIPTPPRIELPHLEMPNLDIDFPTVDIDLPEFTAPEIDIDLPRIDVEVPKIDIEVPELSFDPKLLAGLMPTRQQPTQVEGLFDKELFKFDTEIKSTQKMLSPFMNLRRYG